MPPRIDRGQPVPEQPGRGRRRWSPPGRSLRARVEAIRSITHREIVADGSGRPLEKRAIHDHLI
jgi:hypothetical protein